MSARYFLRTLDFALHVRTKSCLHHRQPDSTPPTVIEMPLASLQEAAPKRHEAAQQRERA
eukprot:11160691-Lingulodinium_polyedra.AAC.1